MQNRDYYTIYRISNQGKGDSISLTQPQDQLTNNSNETISASTDKGELLRWHYRLGHLSGYTLKLLALLGMIPRKLATIRHPPCPCCIATSMARIPTRIKGLT